MFTHIDFNLYKYIVAGMKVFSGIVAVLAAILAEYVFIHIVTFNIQFMTLIGAVLTVGMILLLIHMIKLTSSGSQLHNSF